MVEVAGDGVVTPDSDRSEQIPGRRNWLPFAESAAKQAGLAAAVVYGVVSLGYRSFYDELGVRPEEVGIDRAQVVAQAATALVFILGLASVVGLVADLFLVPVGHGCRRLWRFLSRRGQGEMQPSLSRSRPSVTASWLIGLIVLPASIATFLLYVDVPSDPPNTDPSASRGFALFGLAALAWAFWRWRRARRHPAIRYELWAAFAAVVGVIALLGASVEVGQDQAHYLEDKGDVAGTAKAPGSLISVRADCIEVTAVSSAAVPASSDDLRLLGSSSGIDVMWDATTHQVVRLPATNAVLRSCPGQ